MSDEPYTYYHLHRRGGGGIEVTINPPDDLEAELLLLETVPLALIERVGDDWLLTSTDAARLLVLACEVRHGFEAVAHDGLAGQVFWPMDKNVRDLLGGRRRVRDGTWADELFAAMPPELHRGVYRALARFLHADRGGSDLLMQDLNRARERAADDRPAAPSHEHHPNPTGEQ